MLSRFFGLATPSFRLYLCIAIISHHSHNYEESTIYYESTERLTASGEHRRKSLTPPSYASPPLRASAAAVSMQVKFLFQLRASARLSLQIVGTHGSCVRVNSWKSGSTFGRTGRASLHSGGSVSELQLAARLFSAPLGLLVLFGPRKERTPRYGSMFGIHASVAGRRVFRPSGCLASMLP